ncbi:MAG: FAD-dependent oxidoreductase [Mycoplasmoidaceae bacterium]|nr:FAD-dependent oxidoreductase [Mycoplasmoidaceae bacterium]
MNVATGTVINKLGVEKEDSFFGHGVSYCVNCDINLAKGKTIALIGNTKYADQLKTVAKELKLYKASDIKGFTGNKDRLTGVVTHNGVEPCEYAFVDNGYKPSVDFLPQEVKLDAKQQIIVDESMASPYFNGIFACGDCINLDVKMIQPAMAQAQTAAQSAVAYIKSKR